ncbi:uncharacterized protein LOC113562624 [Ooceraea biroi]|uniref:uncharacterized protein LOC113562624 n=1 Tax=Ooceraea biroi TaxID=2015173 RepID=UPI000F084B38|nr:uncharacterized protein LOC113562624 [Ooceraea biroi]
MESDESVSRFAEKSKHVRRVDLLNNNTKIYMRIHIVCAVVTKRNVKTFYLLANTDEASEICKRERRTRDRTDRGKIIVVVSAAETKPPASNKKLKKKIDDDVSLCNVTSSVHSVRMKDSVDEDGKENTGEKRIPSESKLSRGNCETDKIFPQQQQRTRANRSPRRESAAIPTLLCIDDRLVDAAATGVKPKIPRPANAFMLFANEWRRKLAAENPRESNKDISVRLVVQKQSLSSLLYFLFFSFLFFVIRGVACFVD